MPGRMLMMARKGKGNGDRPEPAPPDNAGDEPRVSSVDQPSSDSGLAVAPHDHNQEQDAPENACTCPNCGCVFDNDTGEILNGGEQPGDQMDVGVPDAAAAGAAGAGGGGMPPELAAALAGAGGGGGGGNA
jgi:hypothetical protein